MVIWGKRAPLHDSVSGGAGQFSEGTAHLVGKDPRPQGEELSVYLFQSQQG